VCQRCPYPGSIQLSGRTDIDRHIFSVHERIPCAAGARLSAYPQCCPATHPRDESNLVSSLSAPMGHSRTRDPVECSLFTWRAAAATAVSTFNISLRSPARGRVIMTPDMLNLQWSAVVLTRQITSTDHCQPTVHLPSGGSSQPLGMSSTNGGVTTFKPVHWVLVDYHVRWTQFHGRSGSRPPAPVRLNFRGSAQFSSAKPEQLARTGPYTAGVQTLRIAPLLSVRFSCWPLRTAGRIGLSIISRSENRTVQVISRSGTRTPTA
jgi:hypothetical protein